MTRWLSSGSVTFLFALLVLSSCGTVWGQAECARITAKGSSSITAFGDLSKPQNQIRLLDAIGQCLAGKGHKEYSVPTNVLSDDKKIISEAYLDVSQFYAKKHLASFTSEDAARIITLAWIQYRSQHPLGQLTYSHFLKLSTAYGQLEITSSPQGASVYIDGKDWGEVTDMSDWAPAGEHLVKLVKKGCTPSQPQSVYVKAAENTTFSETLTCD